MPTKVGFTSAETYAKEPLEVIAPFLATEREAHDHKNNNEATIPFDF